MANPDTHKYMPVAAPIYCGDVEAIETATGLKERFITPVTGKPYLEVTAPSTLPEGYSFEVESNGHSLTVKVPVGGVEEGQKFSVPFPSGSTGHSGSAIPLASAPVGHWKDGLCDCCTHGICHPHLWTAFFCELIATGQVMQRLKLTWYGDRGNSSAQTAGTFRTIFWMAIPYEITKLAVWIALKYLTPKSETGPQYFGEGSNDKSTILALRTLDNCISWPYIIFVLYIITKTRKHIRSKDGIPQMYCDGEDCCYALCCTCCTITQMARHTADYENYPARCCSETGLGPAAPSIVSDWEITARRPGVGLKENV